MPRFDESRFPSNGQILYPVKNFYMRFAESRTVFRPNPEDTLNKCKTSASCGGLSKYNTIISDQSKFLIFFLFYTWATLNFTTPEEEQIPT